MRVHGTIVGAGIIGSAISYELSRRGVTGIHVLDVDLEGELSSTERNAGGVRHLWQNKINFDLARISIKFFESIRSRIGFQQNGYLWLYSKSQRSELTTVMAQIKKGGLPYEALSLKEVHTRYPFLDKTDDLECGLYGSKDGIINSNALKTYYREEAKKRGVVFHDRVLVTHLLERKGGVAVTTAQLNSLQEAKDYLVNPIHPKGDHTWNCDFVILSAGAWMHSLLANLIEKTLVEPVRRQIVLFSAENFVPPPFGMIVDPSHVYFHPEAGNLMAGLVLKNEPPGYRFEFDPQFFESYIWPPLYQRSTFFERLKCLTGWAGLYSYSPDTTGILGRLPNTTNIYEAHSFTGRGLMQSYGVATALCDLVLKGRFETVDGAVLNRERFSSLPEEKWLFEDLHI